MRFFKRTFGLAISLIVLLALGSALALTQITPQRQRESATTYRPITDLTGKRKVYVTLGGREAIPGHEYHPWREEEIKIIDAKWRGKATDLLKQAGFTTVNRAESADFTIELSSDVEPREDNPAVSTGYYIVTATNLPEEQAARAKKRLVYYEYRLFETNPGAESPRATKQNWIEAGINGFLWAYQK